MRRVVACVVMLAMLVVPAVFVNTLIGYLPALFFIAIVAASFAYCRICRRSFVFDEMARNASCVRGETVDVGLRVRNASVLFVPKVDVHFVVHDLFGNLSNRESTSIALNPRSTQDFMFTLRFGHIGQFDVGLERLVIHDPLGLFQAQVPAQADCTITVTPRLREVDRIPLSDTAMKQVSESFRPSNAPGSDYCGVRDYVPGDPLKLIHWKLSARGGTYFTKLFEEQAEPSLDVYLDLSAPDYSAEGLMDIYDAAVETALSLEAFASENGLNTRLLFLDAKGEASQFMLAAGSDFRDLMRRLPLVRHMPFESFGRFLFKEGTSLTAADNVAVCSANYASDMVDALAQVSSTQRNVLMFVLLPNDVEEDALGAARSSLRAMDRAGVLGYLVSSRGGGAL